MGGSPEHKGGAGTADDRDISRCVSATRPVVASGSRAIIEPKCLSSEPVWRGMKFPSSPNDSAATGHPSVTSPRAEPPRRVLFVATDYPPLAGTNTQRIQSFVRHLPASGWQAWVITRAVEDLPLIDPAELRWPEATERVLRVTDPDPFAWWGRKRGGAPRQVGAPRIEAVAASALPSAWSVADVLRRAARLPFELASALVKSVLRWAAYHPDALRLWAERAARESIQELPRIAPEAVVTSHPAYSTHMAGLKIKRRTGLPWVADFRDLWVDRPYRSQASRFHAWIDRRCEAAVVAACDRLVLASPAWVDRLASRYGEGLRAKCVVITNGFDAAASPVAADDLWPENARLKLAWTGAMFESESPATLVEALGRIRADSPHLLDGVAIRLAGYGGAHEVAMRRRAEELDLTATLVFLGPLPHARVLGLQRSAHGLLLAHGPKHRETLQGKMFEYLAAGRPVLAMHPEASAGSAILKEAGILEWVPFDDVVATEAVLRRWCEAGVPPLVPDPAVVARYERARLSRDFARVLESCANQKRQA